MKVHGRALVRVLSIVLFAFAPLASGDERELAPPPLIHSNAELKSLDCSRYQATYDRVFRGATTLEQVRQGIAAELAAYDLNIRYAAPFFSGGGFSSNPLTDADLLAAKKFGAAFVDSWKKATTGWVRQSRLKNVVLIKGLVVAGQHRTAMPDAGSHSLYYDAAALSACMASDEEVIHHEFYHIVEAAQFGSMYYHDAAWAALNPGGFAYGAGGADAYRDHHYSAADHPTEGLVDQYATYGIEEDKAEVYAWSLTPPLDQKLLDWARTDSILAKKFEYMNAFVRAHSGP